MGDGLVEHINCSMLNLLHAFIEKKVDWEQHPQFLLYIYHTTKQSSTDFLPFEIIFGPNPPSLYTPELQTSATSDYAFSFASKTCRIKELVDANFVESAN